MVTCVVKEKIQGIKVYEKKIGLPHIEDLVGRNSYNSNRLSKESIGGNR